MKQGATHYDPRSSQPMTAIVRVAVVVTTIALFASSMFSALQGQQEIGILLALATPLGLSAWGFARAGHNEAAIGLLCCVIITVVTLILVLNPLGVHDMAVTVYGGVVLIGALLLSRRAYYAIVIFTLLAATAAFVTELTGYSRSQVAHITAWPQYVDFIVIIAVFVVMGRTAALQLFGSLGDAHYASARDTTTGLLNRSGFMMTSAMRLREAQASAGFGVLVVADLDKFRRINLVVGHSAADHLLAEVGRRLALVGGVGENVVGRIGDDEFAVLAVGVTEAQAAAFAHDVHASMNFDHLGVTLRCAVGLCALSARRPRHRDADARCAKRRGRPRRPARTTAFRDPPTESDSIAGCPRGNPASIGALIVVVAAIAFSGKAVIIKLAYRHGVDAVTLLALRMIFSAPLFGLLAWWALRGSASQPLSTADMPLDRGAGHHRLLPLELSRLPRPAVHHRGPRAADPLPQSHLRDAVLGASSSSGASPAATWWRCCCATPASSWYSATT